MKNNIDTPRRLARVEKRGQGAYNYQDPEHRHKFQSSRAHQQEPHSHQVRLAHIHDISWGSTVGIQSIYFESVQVE